MGLKRFRVLMVGVDHKTKGGMWSVAKSYLQSDDYQRSIAMKYIPIATVGSSLQKILFFAWGFVRIICHLLFQKWDIVHIHMAERGSVYRKILVILIAKAFRVKVVLHLHGAEFESWYTGLPEKRKSFVKRGLNQADRILILGEYWRVFISSIIKDRNKIRVLHNAVCVPQSNQYRKDAKKLLFLGEVGRRKGAYDLLDAMNIVDHTIDTEYQLLLYGTNPDGDITSRIKSKGLQHRVRYMGWVEKGQLQEIFSQTAVNILPSYNEGLPMTILETMAYGIPNITTGIAAIPEAVNQDNGMLIQPGNVQEIAQAIVCLIRDPAQREAKSRSAYCTAKTLFSFERHMNALIGIYEEMKC